MIDTSSVTARPSRATMSRPSRRSAGSMTCGVCTSHKVERSSVFTTKPSSATSLIVGLTGTPRTAAPTIIASRKQVAHSSAVTRGRAESWMATSEAPGDVSLKPLAMLSWRSAPGSANLMGFRDDSFDSASSNKCLHEGSHTMTTSPTSGIARKVLRLHVAMGRPQSSRYCFGMSAPIRLPTPPDRSTILTAPVGISTTAFGPRATAESFRLFRERLQGTSLHSTFLETKTDMCVETPRGSLAACLTPLSVWRVAARRPGA
mmetsp:Transcript_2729/g.6383  ORF Transcript_2729/g.6383 Transcript_2729/m.6383 type:complete len:261 (+) Transcript_2729:150-932(+)